MPEPMACPINGWADHPWKPWPNGQSICATYFCYYLAERHPAQPPSQPANRSE